MESVPVPGIDLPAIGGEIAGKYRVENILGQGGMGAVFAARNNLTGKRVAIKWLLPQLASASSRERLLREARIAGEIEHPNVVDVYDVGEHDGGLFLVMELLRGRTLAEVLAVRGRLTPGELIPLLVPAMRGVHAAHQKGVVHRDLKPENIFLSELDGAIIPKVLDFGVSKSMDALSEAPSPLTRTGALVGTPHYMAVEQVDGSSAIDQRTDVYGFGVLLYRALTGYFPFDGSSLGEVILKIGTTQPTAPRLLRPELSEGLEAVMMCALARERSARFPQLEAFVAALSPFAPPTYISQDGSPRYSVSGDLQLVGGYPSSAGQRSIQSIVRDAAVGRSAHSGSDLSRDTTSGRYPSSALWAAGLAVLAALASMAAWASTRTVPPAAQVGGTTEQHPSNVPELGPARGGIVRASGALPPPSLPSVDPRAVQPSADPAHGAVGAAPGRDDAAGRAVDGPTNTPTAPPALNSAPGVAGGDAPIPVTTRKWHANPARAQKAGHVIPGDRTKGLSSDDF